MRQLKKYNTDFTDSMKTDNIKNYGKCKHDSFFTGSMQLLVGSVYKPVKRCKTCGKLIKGD